MYLDIEAEGQRIRKKYGLLEPHELKELRKKYNIDLATADALFGLSDGSYYKYENGIKLQTTLEDHLIRSTNPLDRNGFSVLPRPSVIDY
jgi:hypothetical protein